MISLRWFCVSLALLSLAVLAVACEQPMPEPVDVVRPVKMLELTASQPVAPLEYPGRIAATQDVEIAFEVGGLITEYPVAQGQFVKRGQLLARLDVEPTAIWMVGDSAVDVETGKRAGAHTIGCSWGLRGRDELRRAGADHLVDNPREIPALVMRGL